MAAAQSESDSEEYFSAAESDNESMTSTKSNPIAAGVQSQVKVEESTVSAGDRKEPTAAVDELMETVTASAVETSEEPSVPVPSHSSLNSESETGTAEESSQIEEPESDAEEEVLTSEEIEERRAKAQCLKDEGNASFKSGENEKALEFYTSAVTVCPRCCASLRSVAYANSAACLVRLDRHEEAVKKCTKALKYDENYVKALLRRAASLEKLDRLEEALKDYSRVLELDRSNLVALQAAMRLPDEIKQQQERLKEEMLGKLKELGNAILKPFGLSTNNFKLQQDPNTGGYSVNFSK